MNDSVIMDITHRAKEWFAFLDEQDIGGYDYELALSMFNREYDDVELFFEDLARKGLIEKDYIDDHDYLYDNICENVKEILIDPIVDNIGKRLLLNVRVFTIKGEPSTVFGIFSRRM